MSRKTEFKVNVNESVKVKLTEKGIKVLEENHNRMSERLKYIGEDGLGKFVLETDSDGYSKFQLWELMNLFGSSILLGNNPPFETEIIICDGEML